MIYFISDTEREIVKIGYTSGDDANGRLTSIQVGSYRKLEIIHTMPGNETEEKRLHTIFSKNALRGEWFNLSVDIAIFLELPIEDQIKISKTNYGSTFMESILQVFFMQENKEELMMLRWIGLTINPMMQFNRLAFPKSCPQNLEEQMNIADELFGNVTNLKMGSIK